MKFPFFNFHFSNRFQDGFSIFIAIIVVGVLLLVAFSVAKLGTKETQFSNLNRESQYAIFAADAGIECALYWDVNSPVAGGSAFGTSTPGSPISCASTSLSTGSTIPGTTTLTVIGGMGGSGGSWTFCANENGICSFAGTAQVRYGANDSYNYQVATNNIPCNNATFGDPIIGVVKHCDYTPVANAGMSIFGFSLSTATNPSNACAIVTVNKYYSGSNLITHIFSRGYNTCDIANPRRVERGIEVRY